MVEETLYHHEFKCDKCGFKMEIESPQKDIARIVPADEGIPEKCLKPKCDGLFVARTLSADEVRLDGIRKANAMASAEALKMASLYDGSNRIEMVTVENPDNPGQSDRVPKSVLDSLEDKARQALSQL